MGKHFFPAQARRPADRAREMLDEAEALVANLKTADSQAVDLLHLIDEVANVLEELEDAGLDVRPERIRLETVQRQLSRRKRLFLAKAGAVFQEARTSVQPDRERWWWFLDEAAAQERRQRLRQMLIWGGVVIAVLVVASLLYDFVLAPPREVREAYKHSSAGERWAMEGGGLLREGEMLTQGGASEEARQKLNAASARFEEALAEFETAAALNPNDPEYWVWIGVLRAELGEPGAESAFETAHGLYETGLNFLLTRSRIYRTVGDLDAASADMEQAVLGYPDAGQVYYERALINQEVGEYTAAVDDLQKAAELAREAGNAQLEAVARYQLALLMQQGPPQGESTPTP